MRDMAAAVERGEWTTDEDETLDEVARRGAEAEAAAAAVRAEERAEAEALMRGELSCGEHGSSDEEYTLEELQSRVVSATAVVGAYGSRRREPEREWSGRKVPKLRDKHGDE